MVRRLSAFSVVFQDFSMSGWFQPVCPCDPSAKQWVEAQLRWLTSQFGLHIFLERPIIVPTSEFFPDAWDGSTKAARRMFRRVCRYMGVDHEALDVKFVNTEKGPSDPFNPGSVAAGTWSPD